MARLTPRSTHVLLRTLEKFGPAYEWNGSWMIFLLEQVYLGGGGEKGLFLKNRVICDYKYWCIPINYLNSLPSARSFESSYLSLDLFTFRSIFLPSARSFQSSYLLLDHPILRSIIRILLPFIRSFESESFYPPLGHSNPPTFCLIIRIRTLLRSARSFESSETSRRDDSYPTESFGSSASWISRVG